MRNCACPCLYFSRLCLLPASYTRVRLTRSFIRNESRIYSSSLSLFLSHKVEIPVFLAQEYTHFRNDHVPSICLSFPPLCILYCSRFYFSRLVALFAFMVIILFMSSSSTEGKNVRYSIRRWRKRKKGRIMKNCSDYLYIFRLDRKL